MPAAAPLVVAAAAKAAAAAAAKAAFWAAVKKVAFSALVNLALSKAAQMLAGKPKISRQPQDVEYSGTTEARRIIYGEMLVSGMNVIPPLTSGSSNDFLHQVIAVAGHECHSLGQVYFNREAIGTVTAITGADSDGKVTSGRYADKAWVRRYAGTDAQTVDFKLTTAFPAQWTANHRGQGVAYVAMTFKYDEETFRTGRPETTILVQGKRVYDPRLDSTQPGGSGSHRVADPATYAYSTNPALCLADYLISTRLGMGEDASRIDWQMVADAADICDETVTVPSPTSSQKRYTCNVVLTATDRYEDNIEALAQAMAGVCYYSGGRWRMFAGAWQTPSFTIGVDDLIDGGVRLVTALPYNSRYNSVRGTFVNPARNWQEVEFQPTVNQTYITDDGEQTWLDTKFAATTNEFEAQRHAILLSRRSRLRQSATLRCNMAAYGIRPFETGTVTIPELGWSAKTVRCEGWNFDPSGAVEITVREEASNDWNDPIVADYLSPGSITNPSAGDYTPLAPSALTTLGYEGAIAFSWAAPAVVPPDVKYQLYEHTASTPFSSAVKIWEGLSTSVFIPKTDTTTRYYWVLLRSPAGIPSPTEPPTVGAAGAARNLFGTLAASVSPSSLTKTDTTATIVTGSATVTATGGTAPYTYAWTRIAGSTSISATSSTAATTTFTGTSLASGTTYDATFRCTVTDSAAATKTVDVVVSITRQAMLATASPTSLYEAGDTGTITSNSTTVTPNGGTSPYTYSWSKVSGDTLTVTSPTAATTTFSTSGLGEGNFVAATYRCTVTDSTTPTALTATADVSITLENPAEGPPP
jgi:hypothetical protein